MTQPRPTDIPTDGTCEQGHVCLGALVAGKTYTTSDFQPRITFTPPESGWENLDDEGGIFQLLPIAHPGDAIAFFRNPMASGGGTANVGTSVDDLAAWLAANPQLDVSAAQPVMVGGLQGVLMDIRIMAGAQNQDASCPVQVCVSMFLGRDPSMPSTWHWDWGSGGLETQRLYLLTAGDGVVAIFVDSYDGTTFDSLTKAAAAILGTVKFG